MLEQLQNNPLISSFLSEYPRTQWVQCVEATMAFGILTLQNKYPFGLTIDQLNSISLHRLHKTERPNLPRHPARPSNTRARPKAQKSPLIRSVCSKTPPVMLPTRVKAPKKLKEPKTCSIEDAQEYMDFLRTSVSTSSVHSHSTAPVQLAERFLSNPTVSSLDVLSPIHFPLNSR